MLKGKRVGTFTCGIVLMLFGVLFLLRIFIPEIELRFVLSLWPVILILMGLETIVAYLVNREDKIRFDGGSVAILILLMFFAAGMAGMEQLIQHADRWIDCI